MHNNCLKCRPSLNTFQYDEKSCIEAEIFSRVEKTYWTISHQKQWLGGKNIYIYKYNSNNHNDNYNNDNIVLRASAESPSSLRSVPQRQKQSEDELWAERGFQDATAAPVSQRGKPRVYTLCSELLHGRHVSQSLQRFACVCGGTGHWEFSLFFFLIQRQKN